MTDPRTDEVFSAAEIQMMDDITKRFELADLESFPWSKETVRGLVATLLTIINVGRDVARDLISENQRLRKT